ncbi:MAG: family 43 glycosylhydrolase [Verrucomicrobiota bacterium]|nr:family 43 glycosylhydrolase [Verrucomicrobiota bacterium]
MPTHPVLAPGRSRSVLTFVTLIVLAALCGTSSAYPIAGTVKGAPIQNAPDPSTIAVNGSDGLVHWYMYCTSGAINDADRTSTGAYSTHLMTMFHSTDLVNWNYVSDVFSKAPKWVNSNNVWAPDIQYFNGKFYLYYTAPDATAAGVKNGGGAIGVATSASPIGPWADSGGPVVEVQNGRWVYDPFIIVDDYGPTPTGQRYLFYGSYAGGLFARKLSADGLKTDKSSEVAIGMPDRFEGAYIRKHDGMYYLFASSANCCNDAVTGYTVYVGRSPNLLGPYKDREGASFLESRVGGTPALAMNGNKWIGPGHNAVLTDFAGQDWVVYGSVNRTDPSFANSGVTKRAAHLDPLDWGNIWPVVRGGFGPSEVVTDRPAAQPNQTSSYVPTFVVPDSPGTLIPQLSDEFDGSKPWSWSWAMNRVPPTNTYGLTSNGTFAFQVQNADLWETRNNASVLIEPTPTTDYLVETRMYLPIAGDFTNHNYVQAGLVIYGDDDRYIKLVHVAINGTRQTEFGKEVPTGQLYGSSPIGTPADWTFLRIAKRTNSSTGEELYTAYSTTQTDVAGQPVNWVRGGTWTHSLGANAKIGLVAQSGTGYTAQFDYVRVYTLQ